MAKKLTAKELLKKGFPKVAIPGLIISLLILQGGTLQKTIEKIKDYHTTAQLFPSSGLVQTVEDGDTFTLKTGQTIRLLGINAPERGQNNFEPARRGLLNLVSDNKVYLEYDRYQDDIYGRVLAWVWINCESTPKFLPADYMHKSDNESMPGLTDNPSGCKKGKLVNEELIKSKLAVPVVYTDRGPLKYEARLKSP